jgi:UDP-N-acetylmuramoylalanine--D-glutamate ligase
MSTDLDFTRVLILGASRSGKAAQHLLRETAGEVCVVDDVIEGDQTVLSTVEYLRHYSLEWPTLLIASPGIFPDHPILQARPDAIAEVELAYHFTRQPIIGVTGTNGKTTVTLMIADMLTQAGLPSVACGNVGLPMSAVVKEAERLVVELSSFQLLRIRRFRAAVGVWTNFTADHLDYHGSLDAYRGAKQQLFAGQGAGDLAVLNADDATVRSTPLHDGVELRKFSLVDPLAYARVQGDEIILGDVVLGSRGELPRNLDHELANLLAASIAAERFGAPKDVIGSYIRNYRGFAHRVEFVGQRGGVAFYNDSKATTPAAVEACVASLGRVVLLAGGRNKGLDLTVLGRLVGHVEMVVGLGESGKEIVEAFVQSGLDPSCTATAHSMGEAVRLGYAFARRLHDAVPVVLSPGATSFDWYPNYEIRGEAFRREVEGLEVDDD